VPTRRRSHRVTVTASDLSGSISPEEREVPDLEHAAREKLPLQLCSNAGVQGGVLHTVHG
jgi:hypothetical protein